MCPQKVNEDGCDREFSTHGKDKKCIQQMSENLQWSDCMKIKAQMQAPY